MGINGQCGCIEIMGRGTGMRACDWGSEIQAWQRERLGEVRFGAVGEPAVFLITESDTQRVLALCSGAGTIFIVGVLVAIEHNCNPCI